MRCPKCGVEIFKVKCRSYDIDECFCQIDDDCFVQYVQMGDSTVDGEDWYGNAECEECGINFEIATGILLDPWVQLLPYSVVLHYPDTLETYLAHVHAIDTNVAVRKAQEQASEANDGMIAPEDFNRVICVCVGHIIDLKTGEDYGKIHQKI